MDCWWLYKLYIYRYIAIYVSLIISPLIFFWWVSWAFSIFVWTPLGRRLSALDLLVMQPLANRVSDDCGNRGMTIPFQPPQKRRLKSGRADINMDSWLQINAHLQVCELVSSCTSTQKPEQYSKTVFICFIQLLKKEDHFIKTLPFHRVPPVFSPQHFYGTMSPRVFSVNSSMRGMTLTQVCGHLHGLLCY